MNFKIFKNRSFSLIALASFISAMGSQMQDVAFSLYILDITKSGTKFSIVLILATLPQLILGPMCGVIADWIDRKKLLITINLISALLIIVPQIYFSNKQIPLLAIYIIAGLLGLCTAAYSPATAGLLRFIMDKQDLADAYSIMSYFNSTYSLIAPILGALLYSLFGLGFVMIVNGLTFIIAAILQYFANIPHIDRNGETLNLEKFGSEFKEGILYIYQTKKVWWLAISIMIFNFFSVPLFTVGNGYLAKVHLKVTNEEFSLIETISVFATFIGPFLFSKIKGRISLEKLFQIIIFFSSILVFIISIISCNFINNARGSFIQFLCVIFILSAIEVPLNIAIMTMLQTTIDIKYSGRANGVITTLFIGVSPLGQVCYGFLYDHLFIAIPYLISGMAYLFVILIYRKNIAKIKQSAV